MGMSATTITLAIDGNEANILGRVGSNVYAYELLKHLELLTRSRSDIITTVLLARPAVSDLPPAREGWQYRVLTPKFFWTQWALPLHLFSHRSSYSLFFTPGHYAPRLCPVPYVSTVMDTAYLDFPNHFKPLDLLQLTHWTNYSVRRARKIIAISKATKYSVVSRYQKKPEDVVVAYPALTQEQPLLNPQAKRNFFAKHKLTAPYILFLGTLQPRKNVLGLLAAFEELSATSTQLYTLVLAGKVGWMAENTLQSIARSKAKENVVLTGYVSEAEKNTLLHHAECLVLTGFHEGFGIPPLEAMALGTIPIVSNTTSLPEVVGGAGFAINPNKPALLAHCLRRVLSLKPTEKRKLQKRGREQAKKFSWQKTAAIVLKTLEAEARRG